MNIKSSQTLVQEALKVVETITPEDALKKFISYTERIIRISDTSGKSIH